MKTKKRFFFADRGISNMTELMNVKPDCLKPLVSSPDRLDIC